MARRPERLAPSKCHRERLFRALCLIAICCDSARARAGDSTKPLIGAPSTSTEQAVESHPASDDADLTKRAKLLVKQAAERFRLGDAEAAIPLLEEAFQLTGWMGCVLNLAMAHHSLGHCEIARGYYQQYLDAEPYTERFGEVSAALGELHERCGSGWTSSRELTPLMSASASKPAPAPPTSPKAIVLPPPIPIEHRSSDQHQLLKWSLFGAGALTAVATAVFAMAGHRKNIEGDGFSTFSADDPRARDVNSAGEFYNQMTLGFGISTAVLWGSGVTLWLLETDAVAQSGATGTFGSLGYHGRF